MQYMPNRTSSPWPFVALGILSILLWLEILGPALNRPLWYDDLDALMLGRLALEGSGVDDAHPYPLDFRALDGEGHNKVYQGGWIGLNALALLLHLPHPLWRGLHVAALVLALAFLSTQRLKGWWMVVPMIAALFADMPLRVGCAVRTYNLSALGLVLFLPAWARYVQGKGCWPLMGCLVALWQISIMGLAYAVAGMTATLLITCTFRLRLWLQHAPLFASLVFMVLIQYLTIWPNDPSSFTMNHTLFVRLFSQWQTLNAQGVALLIVIVACLLLASSRVRLDPIQSAFLGMSVAALAMFPVMMSVHRAIWTIMLMPILWVETTRALSTEIRWGARVWSPGLLALGALTNIPAWPVSKVLPHPEAAFIDRTIYSQDIFKKAPAAAWHETLHHKASPDEREFSIISRESQRGDCILYEFSRLSLMARLHWETGIPVTGMFPPGHPYAQAHPQSLLTLRQRPFWVLLPVGVDAEAHRTQWLKDPSARAVSETLIYLP